MDRIEFKLSKNAFKELIKALVIVCVVITIFILRTISGVKQGDILKLDLIMSMILIAILIPVMIIVIGKLLKGTKTVLYTFDSKGIQLNTKKENTKLIKWDDIDLNNFSFIGEKKYFCIVLYLKDGKYFEDSLNTFEKAGYKFNSKVLGDNSITLPIGNCCFDSEKCLDLLTDYANKYSQEKVNDVDFNIFRMIKEDPEKYSEKYSEYI